MHGPSELEDRVFDIIYSQWDLAALKNVSKRSIVEKNLMCAAAHYTRHFQPNLSLVETEQLAKDVTIRLMAHVCEAK